MDLLKYKREINLMKKQNMTEYDMYSVIASLIREGNNVESLSLRDVNRRRKSGKGQVFYGLSGIPDLVILDSEFDNSDNEKMKIDNIDKIYGCIEIKGVDAALFSVKEIIDNIKKNIKLGSDEGQILGEVLWYRKVLYTNGLTWMYYECESDEDYGDFIKKLVETRIENEKVYKIQNNIDPKKSVTLKDFDWYNEIDFNKIKINEEKLINIEDIKEDNWKEFLDNLHNIKWN
ncbi:hypothetical protein [Ornithinibacillus xuwenensis]|uniref:Uncharacterized protein n=1 Tax=Ornithinibacillus xuwenensis TaxID=3144668 RepID=A0ABU9XIE3_9BACI